MMNKWNRTFIFIALVGLAMGWEGILPPRPGSGALCGHNHPTQADVMITADIPEPGTALVPTAASAAASQAPSLPVPDGLKGRVKLWKMVYGEYDRNYLVLHHRDLPGIIYDAVFDLPGARRKALARIRSRLLALDRMTRNSVTPLAAIAADPDGPALLELYHKFDAVKSADKFAQAAQSGAIVVRRGRQDEFLEAYQRALPYLSVMEDIFREQGLPAELTRLVFVESMFDREARSSKGAVGYWQLMPGAARPYLVMTGSVDQRRDPLAGSRAAARILAANHARLKTWPLAVTAYNAGATRMQRAVNQTGVTSLPAILNDYNHRAFGEAVENFYAQLMGIIQAEQKLGLSGAPVAFPNPLDYDLVSLPRSYTLSRLSGKLGMDEDMLITFNPSWTASVEKSYRAVPEGYLLRVPKGSGELVRAAMGMPPSSSAAAPKSSDPAGSDSVTATGNIAVTP